VVFGAENLLIYNILDFVKCAKIGKKQHLVLRFAPFSLAFCTS